MPCSLIPMATRRPILPDASPAALALRFHQTGCPQCPDSVRSEVCLGKEDCCGFDPEVLQPPRAPCPGISLRRDPAQPRHPSLCSRHTPSATMVMTTCRFGAPRARIALTSSHPYYSCPLCPTLHMTLVAVVLRSFENTCCATRVVRLPSETSRTRLQTCRRQSLSPPGTAPWTLEQHASCAAHAASSAAVGALSAWFFAAPCCKQADLHFSDWCQSSH